MEFYNRYLKIVEGLIGDQETDNHELNKLCSRLFGNRFAGIYASDEKPTMNNVRDLAIINTDKRGQPGEHWCALVYRNGNIIVYDSFARKTSTILPSLLKFFKEVYDTEYDKEQKASESNCGARCVSALLVFTNHGIEEFLKL
jgi:hypothetical protein